MVDVLSYTVPAKAMLAGRGDNHQLVLADGAELIVFTGLRLSQEDLVVGSRHVVER